ncbi:non-ribosomal peptide synthetase [Actinospica robiniae]|uniref:non-ribosomal peptide synthetase n=1 Tax=Actinospica robiniae TaxID=304901 RepID=UPI000416E633|nr:non-ribosomal peptide synthetase [Actinospica robiniae]
MTIATPAQYGIWLTEQSSDCGTLYHMPIIVDLAGPVREDALLGACRAVADAHPALASVFRSDGDGLQVEAGPPPPVTLADVSPSDLEALTARLFDEPFDLAAGPLARFHVLRVTAERYRIAFVAHHAVFDGMSKDVLVHDLAGCYRDATVALSPMGATEPVDGGVPEPAFLPTDYRNWKERHPSLPGGPRPSVLPTLGACARVVLDAGLRDRIGAAAADLGRTKFELYAAALAALLRRYGAVRPQFSIQLSTRPRTAERAVGLFVNELPVTFDPDPALPFANCAEHASDRLREVYRVRNIPPARLLGKLSPRSAVAAVSLSYRAAGEEPDFGDVDARVDWAVFCGTARNTLNVQVVDRGEQTELILQYPATAWAAGRIDVVASHYVALLDGGVSSLIPIGDLPLITEAESAALLADAVAPAPAEPPSRTLPEAMDRQALATPDAIAVTVGSKDLTYRQLSAASDLAARRLRALGVRPSDLVAVTTPRTSELLPVLLGILKAGAAYVPVDPEYPADRIAFVLEDCQAVLVVSGDEDDASHVPARVLLEPAPPGTTEVDDFAAALPAPSLDATAYVIYTSGSTGRPKGVRVGHRPLIGLLKAMADFLESGPDAVWLAVTSLSFDIAAVELYVPLITGGRCVLAPDGAAKDGPGLCGLLATSAATHAQATPAGWRVLTESGFEAPHLTAATGGEALTPELGRELSGRVKRLVNCYGPTEATIWATTAPVEGSGEVEPIGRPLPGYRAYVLDERLGLLPDGVAGELYLGGSGLAEGYLRRPGLTADRFVPDPFGPPGTRLYRTGDLARRRGDGSLLFLGRVDHQVKVSGYRIEPGEIETALAGHPAVIQAIVSAVEHEGGPARLTAHVLRAEPGFDDAAELRRHLGALLPAYMVPSAFAFLDAWPLTPNGKVDRAALPAAVITRDAPPPPPPPPGQSEQQLGQADASDPVLAGLLEIWCEVLGFDDLGPDEDLFDLGGHSLTAIQLSARIRERFGVDIPVDVFFDEPTAGEIALRVARARS